MLQMTRGRSLELRRHVGTVVVGAIGLALASRQLAHAAQTPGIDLVHVWSSSRQFVSGSGAYGDPLFTYPPSAPLLLAPLGWLSFGAARIAMLVVNVAAVLTGGVVVLRELRGRVDARGLAVLFLVVGALDSVASTWANGNINGPLLLLEVFALRASLRGRWIRAAALLGVSLALKPVLLPLIAILVIRRRWAALGVALGIPVCLAAIGAAVIPDVRLYPTVVLPYLMHGAELAYNVSLIGVGYQFGLGAGTVLALRVLVFALAGAAYLYCAFVDSTLDARGRLFAEAGIALSATLLVSPMSETYYTLFLIPALAWLVTTGRRTATATALFTLACFATLRLTGVPGDVHHSWSVLSIRPTIGWLAVLVLFSVRRNPRPESHQAGDPGALVKHQVALVTPAEPARLVSLAGSAAQTPEMSKD